jgi:serine/threonine protein kinase
LREKTDSVEEKVLNDYLREATNLSRLQHSNIIEFIECFTFKNKFYIVMELCEVNFISVIF